MTTTLQNPALDLIIRAGLSTGIHHSRIYSTTKAHRIVRIRWAIWHTLRTRHGWTLSDIGTEFGTDHSNVRHGINKAAALIPTDHWFASLLNTLAP